MFNIKFLYPAAVLFSFLACISFSAQADENKMKYYKNGQATKLPTLGVEGVNAFLQDIVHSNDPNSPISCGLFRMEKGAALHYTYTYDEAKIIVEGEMTISEEGGETVHAIAGDILYFDEGAKMTFTSDSYGLGFYCGQRGADDV